MGVDIVGSGAVECFGPGDVCGGQFRVDLFEADGGGDAARDGGFSGEGECDAGEDGLDAQGVAGEEIDGLSGGCGFPECARIGENDSIGGNQRQRWRDGATGDVFGDGVVEDGADGVVGVVNLLGVGEDDVGADAELVEDLFTAGGGGAEDELDGLLHGGSVAGRRGVSKAECKLPPDLQSKMGCSRAGGGLWS